jgi:hypothetical protein
LKFKRFIWKSQGKIISLMFASINLPIIKGGLSLIYSMKKFEVVEEAKHPVPNLVIFLKKLLFGENSYLIPEEYHQLDWATQDIKIGDGLLWLIASNHDTFLNILDVLLTAQFWQNDY